MNNDENYLIMSGIQHFDFCRRQWALIHILRFYRLGNNYKKQIETMGVSQEYPQDGILVV